MIPEESKAGLLKLAVAWGGTGFAKWLSSIGIQDWGDLSAAVATIASLLFVLDFVWVRLKRLYDRWRSR